VGHQAEPNDGTKFPVRHFNLPNGEAGARAVEDNLDPHRKAELTVLQHMWLALAAERSCLSPLELAQEIEKIASLHAELAEGSRVAH
jgi:hypothetical protein